MGKPEDEHSGCPGDEHTPRDVAEVPRETDTLYFDNSMTCQCADIEQTTTDSTAITEHLPIGAVLNEVSTCTCRIHVEHVHARHDEGDVVNDARHQTCDGSVGIDVVDILREPVTSGIESTTFLQSSHTEGYAKVVEDNLYANELGIADVVATHKEDVTVLTERKDTFDHPNESQYTECTDKRRKCVTLLNVGMLHKPAMPSTSITLFCHGASNESSPR